MISEHQNHAKTMKGCSKNEFSEDSENYVLGCLWDSIGSRFGSPKMVPKYEKVGFEI